MPKVTEGMRKLVQLLTVPLTRESQTCEVILNARREAEGLGRPSMRLNDRGHTVQAAPLPGVPGPPALGRVGQCPALSRDNRVSGAQVLRDPGASRQSH